jgi:uncharacterized membrane protein YfcA
MEIAFGFLIAMAIGLTGVGGGSLTVPVLALGLGVPASEAVGTALIYVTLTKLIATPMYLFRGQVDRRVSLRLIAGGLPGALIGSLVLARLKASGAQPIVLVMVGLTVAALSLAQLCRLVRRRAAARGEPREGRLSLLAFPIGLEVGFSSAGAGALGSLLLMQCTTLEAARIVGTDLLFGLVLSAAGGGIHWAAGNVDTSLLARLCAGGVFGAAAGAWLATRLPSKALRAGLTVLLTVLGGQMFYKGLLALVR